MAIDLPRGILRKADMYLRMVEGRPYQLAWRGAEQAKVLCKLIATDITKALGSNLHPNIKAAREVINEAINNLPQEGDK